VDHLGIQVESKDIVLRELGRVKTEGLPAPGRGLTLAKSGSCCSPS
jgi:hypothetical protein